MAEFKKYASQGSFSQNQLKQPDEVGKIKEAAERKIRGMNRAQAFLERNREIYLRAQKFAQQQEQMQREDNFRIETENRQAYINALQRDTEIELTNERNRLEAYQKTLSDLTSFSSTAAQLAVDVATIYNENQASAAKDNIYKAGMTLDKLGAIQQIDDGLSMSEFLQTSYMMDVQESEELTEDQKDAYYAVYKGRNTKAYKENTTLLQGEANSYVGFLDTGLVSEEYRNLSAQEKIQVIPQLRAQFLNSPNLKNQRGEVLEASGLFGAMRGIENQLIQGLRAEARQVAKQELETEQLVNISQARIKGGPAAVLNLLKENPSKTMRQLITKAYVNDAQGTGPNSVSVADIEELESAMTESNGTMIPYGERFRGTEEIGRLQELKRQIKRRELTSYDLNKDLINKDAEQQIAEKAEELGADGYYTNSELTQLRDMQATLGTLDFSSPTVEAVSRMTLDARSATQAAEILDRLLVTGNLTKERVLDMRLNKTLLQTYLPLAEQSEERQKDPAVKDAVARVRNLIASDPQVAEAYAAKKHLASIDFVQDRFEREFREALEIYAAVEDPTKAVELAEADISGKIDRYFKSNPFETRTGFKEYTETMAERRGELAGARREYDLIQSAIVNPNFEKDPSILANALNKQMIQDSFDSFGRPDWQPLPIIRQIAERTGFSDPLGVYNFIAEEMDREPITLENQTLEEIKRGLPPIYRRGYDKYRTDERVNRSNAYVFGRTAELPVRPAFEKSGLLPLIREGEGGEMNYNAANRGYAGDTPSGIVNLDSMSLGNWIGLYNSGWNALGAYQLIRSTFVGAVDRLKLPNTTVMNKETQDLIAVELIAGGTKRPDLSAYVTGQSDDIDAALQDLANEWAAVSTEAGNSAYDGIAGNASNIPTEDARQALIKLREMLTSTN